jgi:hypothetical protein
LRLQNHEQNLLQLVQRLFYTRLYINKTWQSPMEYQGRTQGVQL